MYRKLHCLCHMWLEPTERKLRGISLTIVAFYYYLLRSGEYTKPRKVKRNGIMVRGTRTVQFKVKDVGLWKDGKILPRRSSLSDLLQADAATMKITNQKNGQTGQTLLDTTIQSPLIDTIKILLGIVSRHITVSLCVAHYLNSILPKSTGIAPTQAMYYRQGRLRYVL